MPTISTPSLSMSRKLKSALKDWTDNITPVIIKAKSTGGLLAPSEVTALINYIDFLENFKRKTAQGNRHESNAK